MNERIEAEEHLRVIRSLMERATVYRAISAPTALVGGLSALAASAWLLWRSRNAGAPANREFMLAWFAALAVTLAANTLFLWQGARQGNRPFLSAGLRLALRSVIPSLFVAAVLTLVGWRTPGPDAPVVLALSWICLYGLALLSTMNFAPRSLSILGWCFILTATLWLLLLEFSSLPREEAARGLRGATLAMALTFGIFHLAYAACTWSRNAKTEPAPLASE